VEPTNGRDGENSAQDARYSDRDASPGRDESRRSGDDSYWSELIWSDATAVGAEAAIPAAREAIGAYFAEVGESPPRFTITVRFTRLPPSKDAEG
jgi:hypothetical protein